MIVQPLYLKCASLLSTAPEKKAIIGIGVIGVGKISESDSTVSRSRERLRCKAYYRRLPVGKYALSGKPLNFCASETANVAVKYGRILLPRLGLASLKF